jgi:hypothetical protein
MVSDKNTKVQGVGRGISVAMNVLNEGGAELTQRFQFLSAWFSKIY